MRGKIIKDTLTRMDVAIGKASMKAGYELGKIGRKAAKLGSQGGKILGDTIATDAKQLTKATINAASGLLREDKANSLLGYKMKKRGIALIAGAGVASSVGKEAKSYYENDLRGRKDGYITPHAPSMPGSVGSGYGSFGQQAGATGDLVFALNKNRRG